MPNYLVAQACVISDDPSHVDMVFPVPECEEASSRMADKEDLNNLKRKIVAVDKLVKKKEKVEGKNAEMLFLLKTRQKELEEAQVARKEDLEKYGEVWRGICGKLEEEMKNMDEEWNAKMEKKEKELQEKNNQVLHLHSELVKVKKERDEAKKELLTLKAGPTDVMGDSNIGEDKDSLEAPMGELVIDIEEEEEKVLPEDWLPRRGQDGWMDCPKNMRRKPGADGTCGFGMLFQGGSCLCGHKCTLESFERQ